MFSLYSKQNQLWADGVEFYKGKAFGRAEPHLYGIYSIKQRELKSTNGNSVQTTNTITKGNLMRIMNQKNKKKSLHIQFSQSFLTHNQFRIRLFNVENANGQTTKLRDRVQNISQKVDTMKLNDTNGTTKVVASISTRDFPHRDENKNATITTKMTAMTTAGNNVGVSTRRKVAATAADIDNNNDNFDKSAANPTQGDTLNQIKAMRRRHTRLSTNILPVSGL